MNIKTEKECLANFEKFKRNCQCYRDKLRGSNPYPEGCILTESNDCAYELCPFVYWINNINDKKNPFF